MAVVVAGTAPYVSPSKSVQLSPSAVSIGRVLVSTPEAAPSGNSTPGLDAKVQRVEEAQRLRLQPQPPTSVIIARLFDGATRLDVYL